jgi:hypothetical protein
MDSRTIYRTLSSKGTPLQTGVDRWSHMQKVPRGRRISLTCSLRLWGYGPFTVHYLGQFFTEPGDYYDALISKALQFIWSVGLIKG